DLSTQYEEADRIPSDQDMDAGVPPSANDVARFDRVWENVFQRVLAFERAEQAAVRAGGVVTPENRPSYAAVRLDSADSVALDDNKRLVTPFLNYVSNNYAQLGATIDEAWENLGNFLKWSNGIERIR